MNNREIKFRAWDLVSGTMREVAFLEFAANGELCNVSLHAEPLNRGNIHHARFDERKDGEDLYLMQFTGLKDKNGKEIYEGDIRRATYFSEGERREHLAVMEWNDKYACFEWRTIRGLWDEWMGVDVIGNIHENPELLKS